MSENKGKGLDKNIYKEDNNLTSNVTKNVQKDSNNSLSSLRKKNVSRRRPIKSFANAKKRKNVIIIGAIFIIFASIGFFRVGSYFAYEISGVVTGRNKIEAYEEFIQPVVLMDVVPFDSVDKLDEKTRIQIAIWSIVMKGGLEQYATEPETGRILIPYIDIDAEATRLFGPGQKFTHETFADFENTFYYDDTLGCYKIPITGRVGYTPSIKKIENVDNLLRLTVDYIPPKSWNADIKGNVSEPAPGKTLYYYIDKQDNKEFLSKVETIPESQ